MLSTGTTTPPPRIVAPATFLTRRSGFLEPFQQHLLFAADFIHGEGDPLSRHRTG